jgi:AcrR family transcriptional regulator
VKTTREGQASARTESADVIATDGSIRSERRAHLVVLAGELFAQKGYRATTVREIADAAGILSGSLYHHFDSKESIGDEILSSFINEVLADYRDMVEELDAKVELFGRLGVLAKPGAILASNTSFLDLNTLAQASRRARRPEGRAACLHLIAGYCAARPTWSDPPCLPPPRQALSPPLSRLHEAAQ